MYALIEDHKNSENLTIKMISKKQNGEILKLFNNSLVQNDVVTAIVEVKGSCNISCGDIYWRINGSMDEWTDGDIKLNIIKSK